MRFALAILPGLIAASALAELTPFEKDHRWGYKTASGTVVVPPKFEIAGRFSNGIAAVCCDGGWAYIDHGGKVVIRPYVFDNGPDYFRQGVARFTQDGKFGFFDKRGRIVIPAGFDFAGPFSQGRAVVCRGCRPVQIGEHALMQGGKWGYIDRAGKLVIPFQFDAANDFAGNKATVKVNGSWKSIDRAGR